jgi:signal peptidase I
VTALAAYVVTWGANRAARRVTGPSMRPTLEPGQRLVVVPAWLRPPRRGDLVVVTDPRAPDRATVKRVVGLPGEEVELVAGRLHVDGRAVPEPYVRDPPAEHHRWRTGAAQLVVLGDNRTASTDSRHYGPVPALAVRATVVARLRPPGPPR